MQIMIDMKEAHKIAREHKESFGGSYATCLRIAMFYLWEEARFAIEQEKACDALEREIDIINNPSNYTVSEAYDELPLWKTKQIVMTYLKLVFEGENYTDNYIGVLSTNTINSGDYRTVREALANWGYTL